MWARAVGAGATFARKQLPSAGRAAARGGCRGPPLGPAPALGRGGLARGPRKRGRRLGPGKAGGPEAVEREGSSQKRRMVSRASGRGETGASGEARGAASGGARGVGGPCRHSKKDLRGPPLPSPCTSAGSILVYH